MSGADYYRCDVCDSKCFYDARLNWEENTAQGFVRGKNLSLDDCGDMKAICHECAKTNKIKIVRIA